MERETERERLSRGAIDISSINTPPNGLGVLERRVDGKTRSDGRKNGCIWRKYTSHLLRGLAWGGETKNQNPDVGNVYFMSSWINRDLEISLCNWNKFYGVGEGVGR